MGLLWLRYLRSENTGMDLFDLNGNASTAISAVGSAG